MNPLAIFTIIQNETIWLDIWCNHYIQQAPPDHIYILDHDSTGEGIESIDRAKDKYGVNVLSISHDLTHDHYWLSNTASKFQHFLLNSYEAVLYTDVDEIVFPDPNSGYELISDFAFDNLIEPRNIIRCCGYEIVHKLDEEDKLDFNKPILEQRKYWYHCIMYSKPLLANIPISWQDGFHMADEIPETEVIDNNLLLLHLHKIDFDYAHQRHKDIASREWSQKDVAEGKGFQNRIIDKPTLTGWMTDHVDYVDPGNMSFISFDQVTDRKAKLSLIPDEIRSII